MTLLSEFTTAVMRRFFWISIFLLILSSCQAQTKFALELRGSRSITFNRSAIIGGGQAFQYISVDNEANSFTNSFSLGFLYLLNDRITLKLHVGRHQNGRIFDLTVSDDTFSFDEYLNVDLPYNYIQFVPSFSYLILQGKLSVPIELGVAMNKRIMEDEIFYIGVREHNFDLRMSAGIKYDVTPKVSVGSNVLIAKALRNYLDSEFFMGNFDPNQIGLELSVIHLIE